MKWEKGLIIIFIGCCIHTYARNSSKNELQIKSLNAALKTGFIENKGQIINQYKQPNKEVLYLFNSNGLNVQLKPNGFSYEVIKIAHGSYPLSVDGNKKKLNYNITPASDTISTHRIDILFEGSNKNALITAVEPAANKINYYTSGTIYMVHHYAKIIYHNLYPNIDVECVINNVTEQNNKQELKAIRSNGFKYNFIIHPGGNINDIHMQFSGAYHTALTNNGHITIETAFGSIDESIPYSYQINQNYLETKVKAGFKYLSANVFGITVNKYDPMQTLIIDPTPWVTYFGSTLNEIANSICRDRNGNLFIAGRTASSGNIATTGAHQTTFNGSTDGLIAKISASGIPQWVTYYGGADIDYAYAIAADTIGNIYVSGYTNSITDISTTGSYQPANRGGFDGFIAKFNGSGTLQWGTYYGFNTDDFLNGISVDPGGNLFVLGITSSASGIATAGTYQSVYGGGDNDVFVAKFSNTGARIWATYYGGSSDDYSFDIAADGNGNALISGYTASLNGIASTSAHQTSIGGGYDAFIAKLTSGGDLQWGTYFGGMADDYGFNISADLNNNIIATGYTMSVNGIASTGAYQPVYAGGTDAYIVKFNSSGVRQWSTYFGGSNQDGGYGIGIDINNNILVTGKTASDTAIVTSGAYQSVYGGGTDAFIARLNTAGQLQWSTYFGGSSFDVLNDLISDTSGNLYACGYSSSLNGIATNGAYQTSNGGQDDAVILFLPKLSMIAGISNNTISADQLICSGSIPLPLTGSMVNGGDGSYLYNWLSSLSGPNTGFAMASGINHTMNYFPPVPGTSIWYKRAVMSAGFYDTSVAILISIGNKLKTGFTVNNLIQCIKGNQFIFTDTTGYAGNISRLWTFGNGDTSTLVSPVISYNFSVANSYQIKLVASINGFCADSFSQRIFLINNPVNTFIITGDSIVKKFNTITYSVPPFIGSGYHWLLTNGTGSSTSNTIAIKWNTIGVINLKVVEISGGGCPGDTIYKSITINTATGIDPIETTDQIKFYPNPTNKITTILAAQLTSFYINVFDCFGQLLYHTKNYSNTMQLDLSTYAAGIYSIQITDDNNYTAIHKVHLIK